AEPADGAGTAAQGTAEDAAARAPPPDRVAGAAPAATAGTAETAEPGQLSGCSSIHRPLPASRGSCGSICAAARSVRPAAPAQVDAAAPAPSHRAWSTGVPRHSKATVAG